MGSQKGEPYFLEAPMRPGIDDPLMFTATRRPLQGGGRLKGGAQYNGNAAGTIFCSVAGVYTYTYIYIRMQTEREREREREREKRERQRDRETEREREREREGYRALGKLLPSRYASYTKAIAASLRLAENCRFLCL